jgi:hypothetical protein
MRNTLEVAAVVLTSLFLLALAIVSLLGMIDPQKASVGYGMPVSDVAGALFYRVFVSRNLVIVAAGVIFLLLRQWTPLAVLVTLTSTLAVFDMTVLSLDGATPPAFHAVTLIVILVTAALLWRRALAIRT